MYTDEVKITGDHMHKLLSAASGDAALLYLYIAAGNTPEDGEKALRFGATRYACSLAFGRKKRIPRSFPVSVHAIRSGMW